MAILNNTFLKKKKKLDITLGVFVEVCNMVQRDVASVKWVESEWGWL